MKIIRIPVRVTAFVLAFLEHNAEQNQYPYTVLNAKRSNNNDNAARVNKAWNPIRMRNAQWNEEQIVFQFMWKVENLFRRKWLKYIRPFCRVHVVHIRHREKKISLTLKPQMHWIIEQSKARKDFAFMCFILYVWIWMHLTLSKDITLSTNYSSLKSILLSQQVICHLSSLHSECEWLFCGDNSWFHVVVGVGRVDLN